MKFAVSSMWLLAVLTTVVLLVSLVTCYSNILTEGVSEKSVKNTVNNMRGRDLFKKLSDVDKAPVCGRTQVITTNVKREINDYEDTLDADINDVSHLEKILGGNYVTYGEIPWMVAVIYEGQLICGGAVISEFWVISAAHCFYKLDEENFRIVVGDHRLYYMDAYEEIFKVDKIINHERYRAQEINFDIALVKIKARSNGRGIRFNSYVQPVCLAGSSEDPPVDTPLTFSGWGRTHAGSIQSTILKKTVLPVLDYQTCKNIYPNETTPDVFCAGNINGFTDVCRLDGGGPAIHKSDDNIFILYGISVFSTGCNQPNYPSAFASIPRYRGWIDSNIELHSNDTEKIMPVRYFYE